MGADGAPFQKTGCRLGNMYYWGVTSEGGVSERQRHSHSTMDFRVRGPGVDIPCLLPAVKWRDTQALVSIKPTVHKICEMKGWAG